MGINVALFPILFYCNGSNILKSFCILYEKKVLKPHLSVQISGLTLCFSTQRTFSMQALLLIYIILTAYIWHWIFTSHLGGNLILTSAKKKIRAATRQTYCVREVKGGSPIASRG